VGDDERILRTVGLQFPEHAAEDIAQEHNHSYNMNKLE
jgi:hypothetical protein